MHYKIAEEKLIYTDFDKKQFFVRTITSAPDGRQELAERVGKYYKIICDA